MSTDFYKILIEDIGLRYKTVKQLMQGSTPNVYTLGKMLRGDVDIPFKTHEQLSILVAEFYNSPLRRVLKSDRHCMAAITMTVDHDYIIFNNIKFIPEKK